MQARMKNPGVVIPDAMTAIRALNEAVTRLSDRPRIVRAQSLDPPVLRVEGGTAQIQVPITARRHIQSWSLQ